jgi:hypothetical protein
MSNHQNRRTSMNTMQIATMEMIPSRIAMSAYGRALGAVVGADVCMPTTAVVLGATTGRIKGDFPGTSAWRPPSR